MATSALEDIVAGTRIFLGQAGEAKKRLQENTAVVETNVAEIANNTRQQGENAALIGIVSQGAELQAQKQRSQIAQAAGIDPVIGANALVDRMTALVNSQSETLAKVNEVKEIQDRKFLDDPLNFIVGQIQLKGRTQELQAPALKTQTISGQLGELNTALQQSAQTTNVLKEGITQASIEANAKNLKLEADTKARAVEIEGLKYNSTAIAAAASLTKDQLGAMFQMRSAQQAEKQLSLAFANYALNVRQFDSAQAQRNSQLEADKEKKELDQVFAEKINTGRGVYGLPPIEGAEMKSAVALLKSGASKDMAVYYQAGERTKATGISSVATNPAEAILILKEIPTNIAAAQQDTIGILKQAQGAVGANKALDPKDQAAQAAFVNNFVKSAVKIQYDNIKPGTNNLFDVGDLGTYINTPAVASLPVVTKVLKPMMQTGQQFTDPKITMSLVLKAVQDGTVTSSEAAAISDVYRVASQVNLQNRNLLGYGIVPPNAGRNYFSKVSDFGPVTDLADPNSVGRYISQELSAAMYPTRRNAIENPFRY